MMTNEENMREFFKEMAQAIRECGWDITPRQAPKVQIEGIAKGRTDDQWKWERYVASIPETPFTEIKKGAS